MDRENLYSRQRRKTDCPVQKKQVKVHESDEENAKSNKTTQERVSPHQD